MESTARERFDGFVTVNGMRCPAFSTVGAGSRSIKIAYNADPSLRARMEALPVGSVVSVKAKIADVGPCAMDLVSVDE